MGKAAAKAAHRSGALKGTWEDQLDAYSRALNGNQTIGIPIGPDTSLLLAECILSHLDVALATRFPSLTGIRYVDDYEFCFTSRAEAEHVLGYLQHLANEFELALNPTKTQIALLPSPLDVSWTNQLRSFVFRDRGPVSQKHDIVAFFDLLFACLKHSGDEGLVRYAISRMRSEHVARENWPFYEHLLIHCVANDPACLPQVCEQLTFYKSLRWKINRPLWSECLNGLVYERAPLGQSSEVAWAMWVMKLLNIHLLAGSAKVVADANDSICALMALGLADAGLAHRRHLAAIDTLAATSTLWDSHWLLVYQGHKMKWLGAASKPAGIKTDTLFRYLNSKNVSFFDINVPPPPSPMHSMASSPPVSKARGVGGDY